MLNPEVLKKFEKKDKKIYFIGDECQCFISKRMEETWHALSIRDTVRTLGVFDMLVEGQLSGLLLPAYIEMVPSNIDTINIEGESFYKITLKKGDVFMNSSECVISGLATLPAYKEIIALGKPLRALVYNEISFLFDRLMKVGDIDFNANHAIYEMIASQICRDPRDITKLYRHTPMKEDHIQIPLTDIAHAASSTTSRMVGAYFKEGINASLVNANDAPSNIEDILRQ